jgi:hypothetical protein
MNIYGLDFTSAPSNRKPITGITGKLTDHLLRVDGEVIHLTDFEAFEAFLARPGPWIAGLDFPFGQPRQLIQNLGWPETWQDYVGKIAAMSKPEFEETLATYRQSRPPGDKHHLRRTDVQADSRSPMMLFGVPVGKMFFQGAPRLLKSGTNILPCRPTDDNRIAIEAYPALVARQWIGRRSYKHDTRKKQTPQRETARHKIIDGLGSSSLPLQYRFTVRLSEVMANACIQDPTGDTLDALLCAVQAAWAYTQRHHGYGFPHDCDPVEGWIIHPDLS